MRLSDATGTATIRTSGSRVGYGSAMDEPAIERPDPREAMSAIERQLELARASLERVAARRAFEEQQAGALLVDTRTFEQRRLQGDVPGALRIDRTVLEWRLDPTGPWHIEEVTDAGTRVIVMCRQGFSSSLAAASLQRLGLRRATDVIGGFEAWREAGLPVEPFSDPGDPR